MRRILSCLVITSILFTAGISASAKVFTDTRDTSYESAVSVLSDIGILTGKSDENFDPEGTLTRAEMATIAVRLLGVDNISSGTEVFHDVPSSHWAYNNIATAYQLGIINGADKNTFLPEESLTYIQAVKILVCVLGYSVEAEALGGYPSGYLSKASQLGILKGTSGESINRGITAVLLYNSLDCNILVRENYGSSYNYVKKEGATILTEYLKIEKYEGRITDTKYERLTGILSAKEGQVILDGTKRFETGSSNAELLVGYNVTVYAKYEDGKNNPSILSIEKDKDTSSVILTKEDVLPKSTDRKIVYEDENGKEKTITLSDTAKIMYNGSPISEFTVPDEGYVKLILDNIDKAEVIIIEEYENYIVKSKNAEEQIVYFKDVLPEQSSDIVIDPTDKSTSIEFINDDGSAANISDCNEWDILSFLHSSDHKTLKIIRSSKSVEGVITEIGDKTAVIGDVEYKISQSLLNNSKLDHPSLGLSGKFYLDYNGRIAALDSSGKAYKYGWLVGAGMTKGLDPCPQFKLFTQSGEMAVYDTTEKITYVRGVEPSVNVSRDVILNPEYGLTKSGGAVNSQLLRYETDESGKKIKKIEISAVSANYPELITRDTRDRYFTMDCDQPSRTIFLGGTLRTFLSRFYLPNDCFVFNIPPNPTSDKDYKMINPKTIEHATYWTNLKFYDVDAANSISVMVTSAAVTDAVGDDATIGLVLDVTKQLNEDGEVTTKLKTVNYKGVESDIFGDSETEVLFGLNGAASTVITDVSKESESVKSGGKLKDIIRLSDINPGDIVAYTAVNGEINAISMRFRVKSPVVREMTTSAGIAKPTYKESNYTTCIFWFGDIIYANGKAVLNEFLSTTGNELWERVDPFGDAKLYEYDLKTKTYKVISGADIREGDSVFMYRETIYPRMFVKYRNMEG